MRLFDSIGFRFFRLRAEAGNPPRRFGTGSAGVLALFVTVFALCTYLLPFFSTAGHSCAPPINLPAVEHYQELNQAPAVRVYESRIWIEGMVVKSNEEIKQQLDNLIHTARILHPGYVIPELIIVADRTAPYRLIRRVMSQASEVGFPGFQLAVIREFRLKRDSGA